MKKLRLKTGNILQTYIFFVFCIISVTLISIIVIVNFFVCSKISNVKRDLFYIAQNAAQNALDNDKLSYSEYEVNDSLMNNIANQIIEKNYHGDVVLEEIKFNKNKVYIRVNLMLDTFLPIQNRIINIKIEDSMKLKLLEVE